MVKQGTATATPRLRFPEFRGAQSWKPYALIGLADKRVKWSFAGGPFGSNLKASDYASRGVRIIQLQNIGDGEFLTDYRIYTSASKADELLSSNIYPGEILLSKMGDPVGRACIVPESDERYVMCSDGIRLVVDERKFSRDFVFFAINFDGFRRRVEAAATGSTRKRIGLDTLKQLPLAVPHLAEQQKIADCLTSLDDVIAAQRRKVEALKAHKRGLMQQLFPREGETRPRLRFPEFRDAPEWKAKRLEAVAPLQRGFDLPSTQLEAGDVPVVYSNGIRGYHNVGMARGPGLVTGRSGTIGNLHYIDEGDYWPHNTSLWVTDFKGHDPKFVYHLYTAIGLDRFASGSGVPTLNRNDVHAFETRVPVTKDEQRRIADCLSVIDTQITAQANQLTALKSHKQGLMQQLFPAPESGS